MPVWILSELRDDRRVFHDLLADGQTLKQAMTIACRIADNLDRRITVEVVNEDGTAQHVGTAQYTTGLGYCSIPAPSANGENENDII
jgi:hypothetical protein